MKRIVKLNERELSRIIKRVMNEGLYVPLETYTSEKGKKIVVKCGQSDGGATISNEENKKISLTGDMFSLFC
jgi:hypothetical protein